MDRARVELLEVSNRVEVVAQSDATLHLRFEGADMDVVVYPYPTLVTPRRHETGVRVASLRDLCAMKLASSLSAFDLIPEARASLDCATAPSGSQSVCRYRA